jgi:mono/diheme cytochrome c family protein
VGVTRTYLSLSTLLSAALMVGGCSKKAEETPPPAETTTTTTTTPAAGGDPVAKAKDIFRTRCVPCHGAVGQGDGPASATLNPKPRKYADPEWQASVTDDYIMKIIKYGGAAVGKSPAMPNNPDLSDPAVVAALKDIVRSFNPKK